MNCLPFRLPKSADDGNQQMGHAEPQRPIISRDILPAGAFLSDFFDAFKLLILKENMSI
jgi:hypothetical protein